MCFVVEVQSSVVVEKRRSSVHKGIKGDIRE